MSRKSFAVPAVVAVLFVTSSALAAGKEDKAKPPTDPEIAYIAVTANQIDIDAAKAAINQTRNPEVKKFAQLMIDDHASVIAQATALVTKLKVTPQDNATSRSLKSSADKTRAALAKKSGAEFDRAYVDNEVAYHQAVIDAVDTVLIPNASNAELKALLVKIRPALVAHLEHAQHLQKELGGHSK